MKFVNVRDLLFGKEETEQKQETVLHEQRTEGAQEQEERIIGFSKITQSSQPAPLVNYNDPMFKNANAYIKHVCPRSFDQARAIGLVVAKDHKAVLIDMEQLDTEIAQRIMDFMDAICLTHDIRPEFITERIVLIDPACKTQA